jgi:hypothetical protein
MKLSKNTNWNQLANSFKKFLTEAEEKEEPAKEEGGEEEANPFAAAADDKGGEEEEAPADGKEEKDTKAKPETPAGIPIKFNISKVKQYNKANFLSDEGTVKSIDKRGIVVTTQPDDVDVLVNFSDISENVKRFFKNRK